MNKKTILLVTYGGGHVNMIIPLVKALKKFYQITPVVLGLGTAREELDRVGIESFTMHDFLGRENKIARFWGEKLASDQKHSKVPYTESVAYLGLNYKDLILTMGEKQAAAAYAENGNQSFLPIKLMHHIFSKLKPDLVVTTNAPQSERAAIIAATEAGIPSICLVGLFANKTPWIWEPNFASKVCVFSHQVKAQLVTLGRKPEQIIVTGNPGFDALFSEELPGQAERLRLKKNWRDQKILLWASQPEPNRHPFTGAQGDPSLPRFIDDYLIKMIEKKPDWRLVIRPHPNEILTFKDLPSHVEICDSQEPLHPVLKASEAIVVLSSSVGMQAALMNKQVFQIHGSMYYSDLPLDQMGYAIGVKNIFDFAAVFDKNQTNPPLRFAQVTATPAVVNVIMELLQEHEFMGTLNKASDVDRRESAQ